MQQNQQNQQNQQPYSYHGNGYQQQPSYPDPNQQGYAPQNSPQQGAYDDFYGRQGNYHEQGYIPQNSPQQGVYGDPYGQSNGYQQNSYQNAQNVQQYPYGGDFLDDGRDAPPQSQDEKTAKNRGLIVGLFLFVIVCIAGIFLSAKVLRVTSVTVNGLVTLKAADVAQLAGLDIGRSYLGIDENRVKENVESNRYLVFESLEKRFPNTVILNVRERVARANLMVMGVTYVLDEDGMVLERENTVSLDNGLPTVTGMQAREVRVGRIIAAQKDSQLEGMHEVLDELILQGCITEISEINLSSMDSIYLSTRDGYTVDIGGTSEVRAKIGTMRAVLSKLREMGKNGGVIDATVPGEATYSPADL